MKNKKWPIVLEVFIAIVITSAVFTFTILAATKSTRENYQKQYSAWCKLTSREDISFEEWKTLKQGGLLRNQK